MATIRSSSDITALVSEAIKIDKEIVTQLSSENVNSEFPNIYNTTNASENASLSAAERVQRILSTLIEEETTDDQTGRLEAKWDLLNEDVDKLRKLADPDKIGTGIRTVQPWSEIGFALLYKKFIEEGGVLEIDADITEEQKLEATQKFKFYINEFISSFSEYRGF
jgi:hypothetical protein